LLIKKRHIFWFHFGKVAKVSSSLFDNQSGVTAVLAFYIEFLDGPFQLHKDSHYSKLSSEILKDKIKLENK